MNACAHSSTPESLTPSITLRQVGYLIHPSFEANLPAQARIADIGTGTGIWAQTVSTRLPTATIDAFDISASQFPSPDKANDTNHVTYHVQNVLDPFPSALHAQFDLVHVRSLVAALLPTDWPLALRNLSALLKPHGGIQWTETHMAQLLVLRSAPTALATPHLSKLVADFNVALAARDPDGPVKLPGLLRECGFHEVGVDAMSSDRDPVDRVALTANFVVAMLGWAASLPRNDEGKVEEMRRGIRQEIAAGAYIRNNIYVVTARRTVQ